jgi:hypothetical protein
MYFGELKPGILIEIDGMAHRVLFFPHRLLCFEGFLATDIGE